MKKKFSYICLTFVLLVFGLGNANSDLFKLAYKKIEEGDLKAAKNIAVQMEENKYGEVALLKGWILYKEKSYQEAIDKVRVYLINNKKLNNDYALKIYDDMALLVGVSAYKSENYTLCTENLVEHMRTNISEENKMIPYAAMIAMCYYNQNNYVKSLEYFNYIYINVETEKAKEDAIYNISALFSLMGRVSNSIEWLSKLEDSAVSNWLEMSETDSDFDNIRSSKEYKSLIKRKINKTPTL